jgi:glutamate-5-semialdehyde dehydrogenase
MKQQVTRTTQKDSIRQQCERMAQSAKAAAQGLKTLNTQQKNELLSALAKSIEQNKHTILAANRKDIAAARAQSLSSALVDRIMLDHTRIDSMITALETIIQLDDPVGAVTSTQYRPNGLKVVKQRLALGVILMIVEARPNVTIEAAALCFKAGNACLIKGGKEAKHSNQTLGDIWQQVLESYQSDIATVQILASDQREVIHHLLQQKDAIDLAIPRGGTELINYVSEHSKIPVIQHYQGICHLYVSHRANLQQALNLFIDGKTSRPAVCNALETLLLHQDIAASFLDSVKQATPQLTIVGCQACVDLDSAITLATMQDFATEFLDMTISVKIVEDTQQAISHIQRFGSQHSEVIATDSIAESEQFINQVDASVVLVNASSRFSDGGELGLGAEIGISTTKLHAYGPMGLEALTTERYVVIGQGQVRHPIHTH